MSLAEVTQKASGVLTGTVLWGAASLITVGSCKLGSSPLSPASATP